MTVRRGVVALGDSITRGRGGAPALGVHPQSWALWLAEALELPVTILARDGAQARDVVRKPVRGRRQPQLLTRESPNAFAIHREAHSAGGRDDGVPFALEVDQHARRDRLDDMRSMCDLHGRCIGIAIDGDGLDTQALQFDHDFLAELAGAAQEHPGGAAGERRADICHGVK